MNDSSRKPIGISGLAAYVPPYRVWLEDWCEWTGGHWPKVREVVGRSFRMRGPNHSVYTMAATAVMPLAVWIATGSSALTLWAGVTAAWIWSRHRANIRRLAAGTEPPIWKSDSDG